MSSIPEYKEFLNEGSTNAKTYDFSNLNGQLKLNLSYQETDGYDSTKSVAEPEAEIKMWLENKDSAIYYFYTGDDIEADRTKFFDKLKTLVEDFDKKLDEAYKASGFTK